MPEAIDGWYGAPQSVASDHFQWQGDFSKSPGFKLEDVKAGKYGHHLHFWDWSKHQLAQSIDLGEKGLIPLEVYELLQRFGPPTEPEGETA